MPTDTARVDAKRVMLAGIARTEPLNDVFEQLRRYRDYAFPFPADLLVEIAADALTIAGATRATPVSLSDAHRRYLPEWNIRGNTAHNKSRVAIELAVALHGGIVPDYDAVAIWWRVQDLVLRIPGSGDHDQNRSREDRPARCRDLRRARSVTRAETLNLPWDGELP